MKIYEIISKKIKNVKECSLEEIEHFYNSPTYEEYKKLKTKKIEERIEIYLQYQKRLAEILRFLKKKIEDVDENKIITKKILSIHIKAIIDSKKINLNNKQEIEEYGYNFGWLDKNNYIEERFYECGINLINNLKKIEVSSEYCTEDTCKYIQYYEWRKLIWMKTYLLIKDVDKEYLEEKANDFL
jgi:hypothetical protein